MADSKRYNDWYEKAKQDLRGANILFEHGGDGSMVAFHCQQSIEKAIKGRTIPAGDEIVLFAIKPKNSEIRNDVINALKGIKMEIKYFDIYGKKHEKTMDITYCEILNSDFGYITK